MKLLKSMRLAKGTSVALGLAVFALGSAPALADHHQGEAAVAEAAETEVVTIGGAEMLPTRNIVENASNSADHTTLVVAVVQAELADTLSGPGPFTLFAPTNEAFGLLPAGTVDALMQDAARAQLAQILRYHVVSGALDAQTLTSRIEAAGGELTLTTVEGSPLVATMDNGAVSLRDEIGGISYVTQADAVQSNGIIHVINGILVPEPETAAD